MINWQLYQGRGRTKSAARRNAVRRALSCSVQLPDASIVGDMVINTMTDFTADSDDPPTNAQYESVTAHDVCRRTSSAWCCLESFLASGSQSASTAAIANDTSPSSTTSTNTGQSLARRSWFNAAAVLHDVRPSASYDRQTSSDKGVVHATVTVDGQRFEGVGATWTAAKRNAASKALRCILQLRYLTSDF